MVPVAASALVSALVSVSADLVRHVVVTWNV